MSRQTTTVVAVATCVLALHAAAMWALQRGLMTRKPEVVVPVQLLARFVEPPRPITTAPQPVLAPQPGTPKPAASTRTPPTAKKPTVPPVAKRSTPPKPEPTAPAPEPAPLPAVVAESLATPVMPTAPSNAVAGNTSLTRQPAEAAAASATSVAAAPAPPPSRAAAPAVELPSSDASYLQNPRPRYPPISLRLREQGTVLVDVLVSDQGLAKEAKVQTSSGFFRLDSVAVSTVLTWRFVPGKRGGVAQSMWFTVPIEFAIQ